jgi:hypothetical protein
MGVACTFSANSIGYRDNISDASLDEEWVGGKHLAKVVLVQRAPKFEDYRWEFLVIIHGDKLRTQPVKVVLDSTIHRQFIQTIKDREDRLTLQVQPR